MPVSEKLTFAVEKAPMPAPGVWLPPDPKKFIDPWNSRPLLKYFQNLLNSYGYVRLLGLPQIRDNPDVLIESLFVEPEFSEENISPDRPVDQWPARITLTEAITNHPRMVVLGDPGLGKTSLLQWLVTQFCRSGPTRLQERLGMLVPLPFILRELPLNADLTWDGLLELFLKQPFAAPLHDNPDAWKTLLKAGQALVLLDGLDEVSSESIKTALRTSVKNGIQKTLSSRWLMTSRVAGYERAPFHDFGLPEKWKQPVEIAEKVANVAFGPWLTKIGRTVMDVATAPGAASKLLYLAPFNDGQIEAFVRNWYVQREADPTRRDRNIQELLKAIHSHDGTQKLARIPNLLTMMALIHRQRAALPQGRVNLYGDIAEAYLHGIDDFRGLRENAYTLPQKKQWLARLGFEMQNLRTEKQGDGEQAGVMADREQALVWLTQAMANDEPGDTRAAAERLLDYLQRRTGLFTERSDGKWAFLHLSFQEYFAACFLIEEVTGPEWQSPEYDRQGCRPKDLQERARQAIWKETFVFLFEMLGQERPRWVDSVARRVFEETLGESRTLTQSKARSASPDAQRGDMILLAELSVDSYSGFSPGLRKRSWGRVWRCAANVPRWDSNPSADALLGGASQFLPDVQKTLYEVAPSDLKSLDLNGCIHLDDVAFLGRLESLEEIFLWSSSIQRGLAAWPRLKKLKTLYLGWSGSGEELQTLGKLTSLEKLSLDITENLDLSFLPRLERLIALEIFSRARVEHPEALSECRNLQSVCFQPLDGPVDVSWMEYLPQLKDLTLYGHLWNIAGCTELPIQKAVNRLYIVNANNLKDLRMPTALQHIKKLELNWCPKVQDLSPLSKLPELESLGLADCEGITSLAPLVHCPKLKSIMIRGCPGLKKIPHELKDKVQQTT